MKTLLLILFAPAVISTGLISNALVIALNNGMPVSGILYTYAHWIPLTSETKLPFLADILPGYYSIGDILIILGICLLIVIPIIATISFLLNKYLLQKKVHND